MTRAATPLAVLALTVMGCPAAFYFDDRDGGAAGCLQGGCPAGLSCSSGLGCVECSASAECSAASPKCLAAQGRCVECVLDADCGAGHVCEQVTHHCQQACREDNDCASDKCDPIGGVEVCVACTSGDQCQAPGAQRCDRQRGACARCIADADCGSAALLCDRLTGTCRECRASADCGSAVCGRDGLCVR